MSPYIEQRDRDVLDVALDPLIDRLNYYGDAGRVNFAITRIIDGVYGKDGYSDFNTGLGILEAVKAEWWDRKVRVYEDAKCKERGDVYEQ